jgi:putative phage-type endonuclease
MAKEGSATRNNKIAQKVAERLTGRAEAGFVSTAMQWGIDKEPEARNLYFCEVGLPVVETGWVPHPDLADYSGASPDGLVGDDGLVEIKCPNTATHIGFLRNGKIPSKYLYQMQWQMECTDRKWCDFVSYDPRMPEHLSLFLKRVERDEEMIEAISEAVASFVMEVSQIILEIDGGCNEKS